MSKRHVLSLMHAQWLHDPIDVTANLKIVQTILMIKILVCHFLIQAQLLELRTSNYSLVDQVKKLQKGKFYRDNWAQNIIINLGGFTYELLSYWVAKAGFEIRVSEPEQLLHCIAPGTLSFVTYQGHRVPFPLGGKWRIEYG